MSESRMFSLTIKSTNQKTGKIPVSTSPEWTCPKACPYKDHGCYAAYGPMKIWWKRCGSLSVKERTDEFRDFCARIKELPLNTLWRHNQAGDLTPFKKNSNAVDHRFIVMLTNANKGRHGFTYTHFPVIKQDGASIEDIEHNRTWLKHMNVNGFTVNISCNSPAHADMVIDSGLNLPVVVSLPESFIDQKSCKTPGGREIKICPAQLKTGIICARCKLCANGNRETIIGFIAHGTGKKHCDRVYEEWQYGVPGSAEAKLNECKGFFDEANDEYCVCDKVEEVLRRGEK